MSSFMISKVTWHHNAKSLFRAVQSNSMQLHDDVKLALLPEYPIKERVQDVR